MSTKKITQEDWIKRAIVKHGDKFDYSKVLYINLSTPVTIICKERGHEFLQNANNHLVGRGCRACWNIEQTCMFDEFLRRATEKYGDKFDYSKSEEDYQKLTSKIKIICPIHGEIIQTATNHLSTNCGCEACSNNAVSAKQMIPLQEFIDKSNIVHNFAFDYSQTNLLEGRAGTTKVKIICPKHGDFFRLINEHLTGTGCPDCMKKVRDDSNLHETYLNKYFTKLEEKFPNLYTYNRNDFKGQHAPFTLNCANHGEFTNRASSFLSVGFCCPECKRISENEKWYDIFLERSAEEHGDMYHYVRSTFINMSSNINIVCSKHGVFSQNAYSHTKGHGCPQCNLTKRKSQNEWLDYLNIPSLIREEPIVLLDNTTTKVDGYDSLTNCIFEFHGDFFHGNLNRFKPNDMNKMLKKTFQELYNQTQIRSQKIRDAGYQLIEMWESDWIKIKKKRGE